MPDWQHLKKLLAVSLALILALAIVAPQPAHAQFSLGGITGAFNLVNQVANNILSFINNTMRPLLEGVQSAARPSKASSISYAISGNRSSGHFRRSTEPAI